MICWARLAKGTNVIGIQWGLNERKYVQHLNSTWQIIKIQRLSGEKFQKISCGFILHSEGSSILLRPVRTAEESRLLQSSPAVPWRHRLQISLLENRDTWCSDNSFWSLSSFNITCLLFVRMKISYIQAYFLFNRIQERTYSLWAHLWKNRGDYLNPLFRDDPSQTQGTLHLPTTPCNFMYKYVNL